MVTSAGSTTSSNNVGAAISSIGGGTSSVNFDTFLKLLVAQLKNQDPLNPVDGTQFTSQMAQFSQLEQQINSNTYLQDLLKQRDYGQQTLATSYIGKEVLVPGDKMSKAATGDTSFGYNIPTTDANGKTIVASKVTVNITDSTGAVVKSFAGDAAAGRHLVTWDGKTEAGATLPAGIYNIQITASDTDGKSVAATAYSYGLVDSVLNDGTTTSLSLLDGRQVSMDDVMSVQAATQTQTASTSSSSADDETTTN